MKSVVITGVSTGIGRSMVGCFIRAGYTVFGNIRNPEIGQQLLQEYGSTFVPLVFDVTDEQAIQQAANLVAEKLQGHTLNLLINNAGIVVNGPLLTVSSMEFSRQLDVNLMGPWLMAKAFASLLGTDRRLKGGPGRIINIGSISGVFSIPFMGPYNASKYGLEAFNDTLRRELRPYGIAVSIVAPGPVQTPIMDKAINRTTIIAADYEVPWSIYAKISAETRAIAMSPDRISECVLKVVNQRSPRTRTIVVPKGFGPFMLFRVLPALPARIADMLIGKMFKLA